MMRCYERYNLITRNYLINIVSEILTRFFFYSITSLGLCFFKNRFEIRSLLVCFDETPSVSSYSPELINVVARLVYIDIRVCVCMRFPRSTSRHMRVRIIDECLLNLTTPEESPHARK